MNVLVDSDILVEVSRGRDTEILSAWRDLGVSDSVVLYSPVSAAELWAGARPKEHRALDALFAALICVPVDEEVGRRAGDYLRQFTRSHAVEIADALIAASVAASRASLWTRNRKRYPMKDISFFA